MSSDLRKCQEINSILIFSVLHILPQYELKIVGAIVALVAGGGGKGEADFPTSVDCQG